MPTFLYAFYSLTSVKKFKVVTKKCETVKWKTQHMQVLCVFLMAAYSSTSFKSSTCQSRVVPFVSEYS